MLWCGLMVQMSDMEWNRYQFKFWLCRLSLLSVDNSSTLFTCKMKVITSHLLTQSRWGADEKSHVKTVCKWYASVGYFGVSCFFFCAQLLSQVWLFVTLWIVTHQFSLSMGFPRQEYWSGLPFPPPGDLPDLRIKPASPAQQTDSLPLSHQERSMFFPGIFQKHRLSCLFPLGSHMIPTTQLSAQQGLGRQDIWPWTSFLGILLPGSWTPTWLGFL